MCARVFHGARPLLATLTAHEFRGVKVSIPVLLL
jgi:hypothetical protein